MTDEPTLKIGWSQADITPEEPVQIAGQFHARISEGILDPITATALTVESGDESVVLVSCDLVAISDELRTAVNQRLESAEQAPSPDAVVMNATHTHTAPEIRERGFGGAATIADGGIELDAMPILEYVEFAADRIADAIIDSWQQRADGSIAFGRGTAVVGRNRRWVDTSGRSTMYGNTNTPEFSHIEGYEDHSVNVLATYDADDELTGVIVNLACTSQSTEGLFQISADFWHEARLQLRERLGEGLFVLPQASSAGDQSPHPIYEWRAIERMLELKGRTEREELAYRIANAVEETLEYIADTRDSSPVLLHRKIDLELPARKLTEDDVRIAREEAESLREQYEAEKRKLEQNTQLREEPRWYVNITRAYRRMSWFLAVAERYERQKHNPNMPVTLHIIRLGDIAIATNPFEYYLDYGVFIKARSEAVQTFVVQLAGPGSYVPSARSIAGGGYGSLPASTPIGPEGGRRVAEVTIDAINAMW